MRARGEDARNGQQASNDVEPPLAGETSAGEAPAASSESAGGRCAGRAVADVRRDVQRAGEAVDSAGASAESVALDGAVHAAQRADVLRAARLQPALSLVSRHEHGRAELRADGLHKESSAAVGAQRGEPLFFGIIVEQARTAGLMSDEHFTVDGTLIEAWASLKSFQRKGEEPGGKPPPDDPGNPSVDFHGEKRSNETHESKTDPEAKLARKGKGKEAKLAYSQHALMENRNGLLVELQIASATGTAERDTAIAMLDDYLPGTSRITLGGDKGYDTRDFIAKCQARNVTPHVAQNITERRSSAIDGRTTRHKGYSVSQVIRKRVEEIFGWTKTVANFRKTRFRGLERTQLASYLVGAAYNLMRMSRLLTPTPA